MEPSAAGHNSIDFSLAGAVYSQSIWLGQMENPRRPLTLWLAY